MMEVDPDISLGPAVSPPEAQPLSVPTNTVVPTSSSPSHQWFQPNSPTKTFEYSAPALRPLPNPPSAIISTSDVASWPKLKLDQLFIEWFARPDSQTWISNLLQDLDGGKPSAISVLDFRNRTSRYERAHSPGRSKSPTSHGNPSFSPQQAPSSPVSKLFRTHVPFDDSDSPHSPPATPISGIAVPNLQPALSVQSAISMDLGKSGSVSPIALDQQHNVPQNEPWKLTASTGGDGNGNENQVVLLSNQSDGPEQSNVSAPTENKSTQDTTIPSTSTSSLVNDSSSNVNHSNSTSYQPNGETKSSDVTKTSDAPVEQIKYFQDQKAASPDATNVTESIESVKVDSSKPNTMATDAAAATPCPNGQVNPADGFAISDDVQSDMANVDSTTVNAVDSSSTTAVNTTTTHAALPPTNPRSAAMSDCSSQKKNAAKRKILPKFYFPCGRDAEAREKKERSSMVDFFKNHQSQNKPPRFLRGDIAELVVEVVGLPSYFASIIFNMISEHYPRLTSDDTMKDVDGSEEASATSGMGGGLDRTAMAMGGDETWRNSNADTKMADGETSGAEMKDVTSTATAPAPAPDGKPATVDKADDYITEEQISAFYKAQCEGKSREARLFQTLLGRVPRNFLIPSDFKPLMQALLMCHQGLAFLHATPEFQQRYSETVIERIYFGCTRQHNGRLTLSDIKRCKLLDTLMVIDEEDDINRERRYFSYEHFYVLYCRFWELDANHDLQIDKEDLMRYSSHSLTTRIVDRIFSGHARPLDAPQNTGYMSYTDFIWFCLSEEDKTSDTAIDYWFRCIDMDGDGIITMFDMEYFYKEQLHRMESFGHEPVQIKDILCQLLDMISPNINPPMIRRRDLKKCRLAGNFFNILFNLNKFFTIEARDPLQIRQEHATPDLTDWDRFAAIEYLRLSADEEGDEDEPWEEVGDAPNPLLAGEAPF